MNLLLGFHLDDFPKHIQDLWPFVAVGVPLGYYWLRYKVSGFVCAVIGHKIVSYPDQDLKWCERCNRTRGYHEKL